jgi:subtilisin-like proprotein convertase family protein
MQRFSYSTMRRWIRPMLGYVAIVAAIAFLSSSLVRNPPVAKAQDKADSQDAVQAPSATFPADAPSLGLIPDANVTTGTCQTASTNSKDVTFTVSGLTGSVTSVSVNFNAFHSFLQDLEVTLIAPGGSPSLLLFSATGTTSTVVNSCAGSANDLSSSNTYTFADTATANWWTTAATNPVPTSNNRTVVTGIGGTTNPPATTSLNTAFASATANGTWTLRFRDRGAGDTGTVTAANLTVTTATPTCGAKRVFDFSGDGKTDLAVVRNTGGGPGGQTTWFTQTPPSGGGTARPWGIATDFFVPADYDGDGKSDIAVWRPGAPFNSFFYILQSQTNTLRTDTFGQTGDDPTVVADYDGDGKEDPAVYRAGVAAGDQSFWYYRASAAGPLQGQIIGTQWGQNGDFVAPGDYDGDAKADFTVQRNFGGGQAIFFSKQTTAGFVNTIFGTPTDVIVPGYYDADCKADIATLRGNAGQIQWNVRSSSTGTTTTTFWGNSATDFPTQGDYDGDGKTDIAVWRPNADPTQDFYYILNSTGGTSQFEWGQNGDYPVANVNSH